MTRGLKSSEFIIALICTMIGAIMAFFGAGEYIAETVAVGGVYVGGRSAVKSFKGEGE